MTLDHPAHEAAAPHPANRGSIARAAAGERGRAMRPGSRVGHGTSAWDVRERAADA